MHAPSPTPQADQKPPPALAGINIRRIISALIGPGGHATDQPRSKPLKRIELKTWRKWSDGSLLRETEVRKYQSGSQMTNRIDLCFEQLARRKAFIPYVCAGDPTLDRTVEISIALADVGADILELGLPFSDPLADGIVNQLAAQRALTAGATVGGVLEAVRRIRAKSQIPIVLYTYMNPVLQFGWTEFHKTAESAGVDGVLILDLPPEEDVAETGTGIAHIRLIAPTTAPARKASIAKSARGFIYYVSQTGVTGRRERVADSLKEEIGAIRAHSDLPVAVGFGISTPAQAAEVARVADAVVVGSAIVEQIAQCGSSANLPDTIARFVKPFVDSVKRI